MAAPFPGTPKGRPSQTHPEVEVYNLPLDLAQDGEAAIHQSCLASTSVDAQRESEGGLLPCMSSHSTPPVPQIQLGGHKLH